LGIIDRRRRSEPHTQDKALYVYAASKILAERAVWSYAADKNPQFDVNVIVPMAHFGEFVHPKLISSMNGLLLAGWNGDASALGIVKSLGANCLINLEDSGLIHVAALTFNDVRGERILALGDGFTFNDVIDVMRRIDPEKQVPAKIDGLEGVKSTIDSKRFRELLARLGRKELTGLEESVRQCVRSGAGAVV
jgi:nucleoside-diphosphate-sugar epimerase